LGPLLVLILEQQGSNDVSKQRTLEMRSAVDKIPSSAWLFYSVDGKTRPAFPNPLSNCPNAKNVSRVEIDPVFVAKGDDLEVSPRGGLIGLQAFQMRQIYALMLGAHLKNAKPQACRNEGGLNLRFSSAADILERDGKERSEKAISPLQIESDSAAFGCREAKLYGCALQREAWDANTALLSPLIKRVQEPLSKERRSRGEWGDAAWLNVFLATEFEDKQIKHDVELCARNQLESAAEYGIRYPQFSK
jgi:hypothetical protein